MEDYIYDREDLVDVENSVESTELVAQNDENNVVGRRTVLLAALSCVVLSACDKVSKVLGTTDQVSTRPNPMKTVVVRKKTPKKLKPTKAPEKLEPTPPRDPNRPEFLDQNRVEADGLALLMSNNDVFDRYIFNAATDNRAFTNTYQIQKGYKFRIDGEVYEFPYHAFIFKAFDKKSNVQLPKRLGQADYNKGLVDFFNSVTRYKADNQKDIEAIKQILVTTFEFALKINLDPKYIIITPDSKGNIRRIKYKDPQQKSLVFTSTIATKTEVDDQNKEVNHVVSKRDKKFHLLDKYGNLKFPPSIYSDQGIAIPFSALKEQKNVAYSRTFKSQGETIGIKFNLPIQEVLDEQDKLFRQGRSQKFHINDYTITSNLGWYVLDNDPFVNKLAIMITERFRTKRQKMQAILDFAHSYDYVPDTYGEAPRSPRVSLISKGGDCEDSSILVAALANGIGIECVFTYFEGHAAVACDIGAEGTAFTWENKRYEWVETTGGNEGVVSVTRYQDPYTGEVVRTERTARGWKIGEKPPNMSPLRFVSRIDGKKLVRFRE